MCVPTQLSGPAWITNNGDRRKNRARMTAILALLTVILAVAAAGIGFLAVKKQKYEKQLSLGEKVSGPAGL